MSGPPAPSRPVWRSIAPLTAAVVLTLSAACGGDAPDLEGHTYTSTASSGHDLVAGSRVTLSFEDGRISANAGCNTMSGSASWEGDTLDVTGPLASTMMACDEALMAQDRWLSEFLESSPALSLSGTQLTLGGPGDGLTLTQEQ